MPAALGATLDRFERLRVHDPRDNAEPRLLVARSREGRAARSRAAGPFRDPRPQVRCLNHHRVQDSKSRATFPHLSGRFRQSRRGHWSPGSIHRSCVFGRFLAPRLAPTTRSARIPPPWDKPRTESMAASKECAAGPRALCPRVLGGEPLDPCRESFIAAEASIQTSLPYNASDQLGRGARVDPTAGEATSAAA